MNQLTMKIDGMSCGHCVRSVTKALEGLEGVHAEQVKVGGAVVTYDPASMSPDRIAAAIQDEGYTVVETR